MANQPCFINMRGGVHSFCICFLALNLHLLFLHSICTALQCTTAGGVAHGLGFKVLKSLRFTCDDGEGLPKRSSSATPS